MTIIKFYKSAPLLKIAVLGFCSLPFCLAVGSSQVNAERILNPHGVSAMNIDKVSVQDAAKEVVKTDVAFIDVREPDEFAVVAAKGAKLFPLSTLDPDSFEQRSGIKKTQDIYIICRSGSRSMMAATALHGEGFLKVHNVEGGTIAWQAAGLPLNKAP
ncbi:MAG: rhodanese-like domain-containing protein [Proteobacteria bacterium]|nr:rhodanese-like domain-containing protein [Pseudomonadota bacterium]